jgi:hypothetical protein
MQIESKKMKPTEKTDEFETLQWLKRTRARKLCLSLPEGYTSRLEAMEAAANNRSITTLEIGCKVRFVH